MSWRKQIYLASLLALSLTVACQKAREIRPAERPQVTQADVDAKALAQADMDELGKPESAREADALKAYDQSHNNVYSRIFGGASKTDAKRFVDERIHYFVTATELRANGVLPETYHLKSWPGEVADPAMVAKDAKIAANNLGFLVWINAQARGETLMFPVPGAASVPVDSPRVGIMLLGPGYRPTESVKISGVGSRVVPSPTELRQGALVHEARHSDCREELVPSVLQDLRAGGATQDFIKRNAACGNMHIECPQGHNLAGIVACDSRPWGAYAVHAVFLEAALAEAKANGRANDQVMRAQLESAILDYWGRVSFNKDEIVNGQHGEPDIAGEKAR